MKKSNLIAFVFVLFLFFIYLILVNLHYPFIYKKVIFSILKDQSLKEIALNLKTQNIIFSSNFFIFYIKLNQLEKTIKAGDYIVNLPISIKELVKKITSNNVETVFLIKEGETLLELEENLKKEGVLNENANFKEFKLKDFPEFALKLNLGDYLEKPLEGFIYPDSYHLPKGLSEKEILNIFLINFLNKVDANLIAKINKEKKNLYEVLILASLVEKEVQKLEDKRMVADILLRRLKIKMPLQVDATICYALYHKFYNCKLKKEDFKIDSLYNSYLYQGLPPTPIANPSKETIEAVLNPIENDYWYYLTNRKTGETVFSKTLEEHELARQKYL